MIQYAQHNYTINNLSVQSFCCSFQELDIDERFDFIISNPPFYGAGATQSENEHINIARYAHHLPIDVFVSKAKQLLRPRGRVIFCYDAKQIDIVLHSLIKYKINPGVIRFVHSKVDRESKLVMIAARANSNSMLKVLAPLIVFDEKSNYSDEAYSAFLKASTNSIKGDYEE